jgi:hypothetical protein
MMDNFSGRARATQPGQQIVLYAHSGAWWIQPFVDQPFTKINSDSSWRNSIHLGTEYAALLVGPGYKPLAKLDELPKEGNGVLAIAIAAGKGAPVFPKVIHFSGYDWTVRTAKNSRGGEMNSYNATNAWVDQRGFLHLRMREIDGHWTCAEVTMNRTLGYGSYSFTVQDTSHFGPSPVLGMFLWDEATTDNYRNELDIEISRWGNPSAKNAHYVIQPYFVPENVFRFQNPSGTVTHMFRWEPGRVLFRSSRGPASAPASKSFSEHVFTSGIPTHATEVVHICLYDFKHSRSTSQQPAEVVIERFEYLP